MIKQTVFSVTAKEKFNSQDFIVSTCNDLAYKSIIDWPNGLWGVAPYDRILLLVGPESSGKTFLAHIWQDLALELDINTIIAEDIDSSKYSEEELLHIFNDAYLEKKWLLLTASTPPSYQLPDLASRIKALNTVEISLPDDELMQMLIFKLFSSNAVKVSSEVVSYLLKILPRKFDQIHSKVNLINQEALALKRKITISFVKEVFKDQNSDEN